MRRENLVPGFKVRIKIYGPNSILDAVQAKLASKAYKLEREAGRLKVKIRGTYDQVVSAAEEAVSTPGVFCKVKFKD